LVKICKECLQLLGFTAPYWGFAPSTPEPLGYMPTWKFLAALPLLGTPYKILQSATLPRLVIVTRMNCAMMLLDL